jgi:hypothetical protein
MAQMLDCDEREGRMRNLAIDSMGQNADAVTRRHVAQRRVAKRLCEAPGCAPATLGPRPRLAEPGSRLCGGCRAALARDLASLPALHAECGSALAHCSPRAIERVTGSPAGGIELNDDAVEARSAIGRLLASWSARVVDERGVARPSARGHVALARFLIRHLDWLVAHPAAGQMAGELRRLARDAHQVSRRDLAPRRVELGSCVHPGCEAVMSSSAPAADAHARMQVTCEAGHSWPPDQWLILARRIEGLDPAERAYAAS